MQLQRRGVSLWPLDQIVDDTQFYVRDAVIDYITAKGTVSPAIEGGSSSATPSRRSSRSTSPTATAYLHPSLLTLDFSAVDGATARRRRCAVGREVDRRDLDGTAVTNGQVIDLLHFALGNHTLTVTATDFYGNASTQSVTFSVTATVASLRRSVNRFYAEGKINKATVRDSLLAQLTAVDASITAGNKKQAINQLNAFISLVKAQSGKAITKPAADLLIADARYVIGTLK